MQCGAWSLLGPLQWSRYVNKQVAVKAGKHEEEEEEEHRGWLLTVDPVSASLVLVDFRDGGRASVQVVMGHAVDRVQVLQEADQETVERLRNSFLPSGNPGPDLDPEQLRTRRGDIRSWLEKNRIPVQEDGDQLRVAGGVLTIRAPYRPEDCWSQNQIILDRIQRLLNQNQSDPEPDQPGLHPETPDPEPV
ncbi:gem-associated protein 6 [Symphorus nematophorus]